MRDERLQESTWPFASSRRIWREHSATDKPVQTSRTLAYTQIHTCVRAHMDERTKTNSHTSKHVYIHAHTLYAYRQIYVYIHLHLNACINTWKCSQTGLLLRFIFFQGVYGHGCPHLLFSCSSNHVLTMQVADCSRFESSALLNFVLTSPLVAQISPNKFLKSIAQNRE